MRRINNLKFSFIFGIILTISFIQIFFYGVSFAAPEEELEPLPLDLPQGAEVICVASSVNLREDPTVTSNNVLAIVHKNDVLIFQSWVEGNSEWIFVKFGDILGYCNSKYFKYNPKAVPSPTPYTTPSPSPSPTPIPTKSISSISSNISSKMDDEIETKPKNTSKVAPTPNITSYENQWMNKSVIEKLSIVPLWLLGIVIFAIIIITFYAYIKSKR